jgi:FdhD protein
MSLQWLDQAGRRQHRVFTVTMRTPGEDTELALGLLRAEGLVRSIEDIVGADYADLDSPSAGNELEVRLAEGVIPDWDRFDRNLVTHSSCGVCGKTSLQSIELKNPPQADRQPTWLDPAVVTGLGDRLRSQQQQFRETGGVHAVGLFDAAGELRVLREDVGRHNAMDKVIGASLLNPGHKPAQCAALLSGRVSFELVQKAVMGLIPVVIAVGAPSSLAISVAQRFDLTLIGFASSGGFNVYHGDWRLNYD